MKKFNLLTLLLLLGISSCMKSTEDPNVLFDGEKIDFGGNNSGTYNNNGASGALGLYANTDSILKNSLNNQIVEIYVTDGTPPFTCEEECIGTCGSSPITDLVTFQNPVYPYNTGFSHCEVNFEHWNTWNKNQSIKVTDANGSSEVFVIKTEYAAIVSAGVNHSCHGKRHSDYSIDYQCTGMGPTYGFGGSNMFLDNGPVTEHNEATGWLYVNVANFINQIDSGANHTCIQWDDDMGADMGGIYCIGDNSKGQLGIDSTLINGYNSTGLIQGFVQTEKSFGTITKGNLSLGKFHTCLLEGTTPYCFGDNSYGQLGLADNYNRGDGADFPTVDAVIDFPMNSLSSIATGLSVSYIAAGDNHTCVTDGSASVACWGNNSNGQLGIGSTINTNSPTATDTFMNVFSIKGIAAGTNHTCVLYEENFGDFNIEVKCFGSNSHGQLGFNFSGNLGDSILEFSTDQTNANFSYDLMTIQENELNPCTDSSNTSGSDEYCREQPQKVFAGGNKTCVLTDTKKLKCLGHAEVAEVQDVREASVSSNKTCVVFLNNVSQCWGGY